eukprot:scaffold264981_cov34-Tisochrysis_lutea.AAC.2
MSDQKALKGAGHAAKDLDGRLIPAQLECLAKLLHLCQFRHGRRHLAAGGASLARRASRRWCRCAHAAGGRRDRREEGEREGNREEVQEYPHTNVDFSLWV